ncbi:uridine kinase [Streptomyces sp. NPDC091272]|uniref:uridine kinase family protein n=1 Tax=Streptomyces sp. NPDC091272 TaxID=3365981 RepID=UPI00381FEDDC
MLLTLTGGSGAGKTTLAAALEGVAPVSPVRVLHGDDYYFTSPGRGVWAADGSGTPRLDVGDPGSVDLDRLDRDVTRALDHSAAVVVDGLFAHRVARRTPGRRLDVFVDLPADVRLARKIARKCLRDGFPLDVLLRNYVEHRRDAHERHVEPVRHDCDLVVDGSVEPALLAARVWSAATAGSGGVR